MHIYILAENNITVFGACWLSRQTLRMASAHLALLLRGGCGSRPRTGGPSGAFGLAASWAQKLALGDNVRPAAQQLLTALTDKVLSVPGQVFYTLVVLREYDLGRRAGEMNLVDSVWRASWRMVAHPTYSCSDLSVPPGET